MKSKISPKKNSNIKKQKVNNKRPKENIFSKKIQKQDKKGKNFPPKKKRIPISKSCNNIFKKKNI
jgi:hypothetical protein